MKPAIPILRIFDEKTAKEYYTDFLEFAVDWEHRYEPEFPLYMQLSKGDCILHLSGHHGDACPGAAVRIDTSGLAAYCDGLRSKRYRHARPGRPAKTAWGTDEITLTDPFGNRLTFYEAAPKPS